MGYLVGSGIIDPAIKRYNGGGSSFTMDNSGTTNGTLLWVGGVAQVPGTDYNVSGTTISTTSSTPSGTNNVVSLQLFNTGLITTPADNTVTAAKIQNDAIDSQHYAAGSIDLEHMSSQSVDEDNLHISNAGSNGQFLSKQSGNAGGMTWAEPVGNVVKISTTTFSGASTVDITGFDNSTYDSYFFIMNNIAPGTDGTSLDMRFSTDGGSSFISANEYRWSQEYGNSGGNRGISGSGATNLVSEFRLTQASNWGSASNEDLCGILRLFAPGQTTFTHYIFDGVYSDDQAGFYDTREHGCGIHHSAVDTDGIQWYATSGTISGKILMYGVK